MTRIMFIFMFIIIPFFSQAQITKADREALKLPPSDITQENLILKLRDVVAQTYGDINAGHITDYHRDMIVTANGSEIPLGPYIVAGNVSETQRIVCRVELDDENTFYQAEESAVCIYRNL